MKILKAWIDKYILRKRSSSASIMGFEYEYDRLIYWKKTQKEIRKEILEIFERRENHV